MFSQNLRAAARELPGLMQCTADQARDAAVAAWNADTDPGARTWLYWLTVLQGRVETMRKASHELDERRRSKLRVLVGEEK